MSATDGRKAKGTFSFQEVFDREIADYVSKRRSRRGDHGSSSSNNVSDNLVGLALSGGGIRSATTNLGILQALSRLRVLELVDYLCTVSGGGYIGGCLSALLSPDPEKPDDPPDFSTQWRCFPFNPSAKGKPSGAQQLRHLRTHGTFLILRRGLFAPETLRAVGNVLTGIGHCILCFLLALLTAGSFYLWGLEFIAPKLQDKINAASSAAITLQDDKTAHKVSKSANTPPTMPSGLTAIPL